MATEIIQMKISLEGIKPEIWRRFVVDISISLSDLHDTIQVIMGWGNTHIYAFYINGAEYLTPEGQFDSDAKDPNAKNLKNLKLKTGDVIRYVYDFGDNWEHTIKIEKVSISEEKTLLPRCLEGARNCPPEDCGAIPGYKDILEAMKNPNSAVAKEILEWLGEPYDPELFDLKEINDVFAPENKNRND
jgi:hypothetical protein